MVEVDPEKVKLMRVRIRDSTELTSREFNAQLGKSRYWLLGKVEGQLIDKLLVSEETGGEGEIYNTESTFATNGDSIVTTSHIHSDPYDVLGLTKETI